MRIRMDYEVVIQQADRLTEQAGILTQKINRFDQFMKQIDTVWVSPSSEIFKRNCAQLKLDMMATQKETESLGHSIKNIAEQIRRADDENRKRTRLL